MKKYIFFLLTLFALLFGAAADAATISSPRFSSKAAVSPPMSMGMQRPSVVVPPAVRPSPPPAAAAAPMQHAAPPAPVQHTAPPPPSGNSFLSGFAGGAVGSVVGNLISSPHTSAPASASPPASAAYSPTAPQQYAVVNNEGIPAAVTLPAPQQFSSPYPPTGSNSFEQSILSFFSILFKLLLIIAFVLALYFFIVKYVVKYVAKRLLPPSGKASRTGLFDDYPDSERPLSPSGKDSRKGLFDGYLDSERDREECLDSNAELPFSPIKFFRDTHLAYLSKNEKQIRDLVGPNMVDVLLQNMKDQDGSSEYDATVSYKILDKAHKLITIRYTGHDHDSGSEIDEMWHFVPKSGSADKWCVNGITQVS